MRAALLLIPPSLMLAGCRGPRAASAPAGGVRSRADTVDVLEAVWRAPASAYTSAGVRWLYLPGVDTVAFTASDAVRAALARRGIPASARRPTGHDTVVYQVRRWTRDSMGRPLLAVSSQWTQASVHAPGGCITAGNSDAVRAYRTPAGWTAEPVGPGVHGVGYCRPRVPRP